TFRGADESRGTPRERVQGSPGTRERSRPARAGRVTASPRRSGASRAAGTSHGGNAAPAAPIERERKILRTERKLENENEELSMRRVRLRLQRGRRPALG